MTDLTYGDAITTPFWTGCIERRFLIQTCRTCASRQFYPRSFCLACQGRDLTWVESTGCGVVHSMVTVRVQIYPELSPPYVAALVDLDDGIRILSNVVGDPCRIGDRVTLDWRAREGLPPLPIFRVQKEA
jgi:uncharacterized protein